MLPPTRTRRTVTGLGLPSERRLAPRVRPGSADAHATAGSLDPRLTRWLRSPHHVGHHDEAFQAGHRACLGHHRPLARLGLPAASAVRDLPGQRGDHRAGQRGQLQLVASGRSNRPVRSCPAASFGDQADAAGACPASLANARQAPRGAPHRAAAAGRHGDPVRRAQHRGHRRHLHRPEQRTGRSRPGEEEGRGDRLAAAGRPGPAEVRPVRTPAEPAHVLHRRAGNREDHCRTADG